MEEQERPRKLAKIDHDEDTIHEVLGPAMTGAGDVAGNKPEPVCAQIGNEPLDLSEFTVQKDTKPANESTPQDGGDGVAPVMSKNQMKKLRRAEAHQQKRALQKSQKKEKLIKKRDRRRAMVEEAGKKAAGSCQRATPVMARQESQAHQVNTTTSDVRDGLRLRQADV
jgi:hypothetical protein